MASSLVTENYWHCRRMRISECMILGKQYNKKEKKADVKFKASHPNGNSTRLVCLREAKPLCARQHRALTKDMFLRLEMQYRQPCFSHEEIL